MTGWLGNAYPWVKAAHVIFVIFWMAGLFMLPRFLVYHQEAEPGSAEAARWVEREQKLRAIILTPSLVIVWLLGLSLAANLGGFSGVPGLGWLHAKIALVVLLSGYHGYIVAYSRRLARGEQRLSGKQLRLLNEVPGIMAVLIVVLVIAQPF
ncbi:MAG: CopD family protein [Sphingomonas sp.]